MKKPAKGIKNNPILTIEQAELLEKFAATECNGVFRLSGGTALSAFYLEHRLSEDLDFFSNEKIPFYIPEKFLSSLGFVDEITHTKLFDRNIFNLRLKNGTILKTEFVYYPLKNINAAVIVDGLHVDNFIDIVINKLCAVADRSDAKDYVDIYCALTSAGLDIKELFALAHKKCMVKGIRHILKNRLLQVPEGVENLSLRIEITRDEIENLFKKNIKKLIEDEIDSVK